MIDILQHTMMLIGTAVGILAVLTVWGTMFFCAVDEDVTYLVKHFHQSRKDTKMFHQVEEFRRDFS